jgi:hypothetical protein
MSGLVGELRSINPDDPVDLHDLGGYDAGQVSDLVEGAFGKKFPCTEPVKVSFVVGAGKKGRQKYSPSLPKELIAALSKLGFEEDRGASACWECCGNFKYQHDTDKDLKFLHVFPHVTAKAKEAGDEDEGFWPDGDEFDEIMADSPEAICRSVSLDELEDYVKYNVKKFSQKRVLLMKLKGFREDFEALEEKMINSGQELTPREDQIYNSSVELSEKIEWVSASLEKMVNDGKLTKGEVALVRDQLTEKLRSLEGELSKAKADGKAKKQAKIEEAIAKVEEKKESLSGRKPIVYAIKHGPEIRRLRLELAQIAKLEGTGGNQLKDVQTLKKIGQKEKLQEELDYLMAENMGWFETKGSIEEMMPSGVAGKNAKPKAKASGSSGGGGWATKAPKKGGNKSKASKPSNASSNPFDLLGC